MIRIIVIIFTLFTTPSLSSGVEILKGAERDAVKRIISELVADPGSAAVSRLQATEIKGGSNKTFCGNVNNSLAFIGLLFTGPKPEAAFTFYGRRASDHELIKKLCGDKGLTP